MNKKAKILLVSNGFFPEISPRSYRATELARELSRQGHSVKVITRYRPHNYEEFLRDVPIELMMWKKSWLPRVPDSDNRFLSRLSGLVSRILSLFFEYPAIDDMFKVRRVLRHESDYDLMISFAVPYPVHWGVAWARKKRHKIAGKWIADCGDPYMGDVVDTFRKPFYFKYFEKAFCRKADYITIPIEGAIDGYYREFHNKIRVIPQGFNIEIRRNGNSVPENRVPTFAYAGGFIPGVRDPGLLMEYLSSVDKPFKFLVFTNQPEFFAGYTGSLGDRLVVSSYIPRNELLKILEQMDFLINLDNNTTLNSPSKLIDYSIAGRPVLNITRDFRADDLLAFLSGNYERGMSLPDPEQFHIKNIALKFLDLMEKTN
jgi:hypothetical protein